MTLGLLEFVEFRLHIRHTAEPQLQFAISHLSRDPAALALGVKPTIRRCGFTPITAKRCDR